jgi:hypothetical protein
VGETVSFVSFEIMFRIHIVFGQEASVMFIFYFLGKKISNWWEIVDQSELSVLQRTLANPKIFFFVLLEVAWLPKIIG